MVSQRPLTGTRVVDLTRFVAGSYATLMLSALGAEVIKVEVPPKGDPYRDQGSASVGGESAIFLALNSGKKSLALDFRSEESRAAVERLLASADFVVENSRPGSLARYGFDFDSIHERHPHLVYGSVSGFGEAGPYATRGGFDVILQAEAGIMSVTGTPSSGPVKVGAPLLDVGAGLSCVVGILAAHTQRVQTGTGVHVSSSLFEFALAGLTTLVADHLASGEVPGLLGTHSPTFSPYGLFHTKDSQVAISGAGSEHLWVRLCEALSAEELIEDPRFATNMDRVRHRDELTAAIERILALDTTENWVKRLEGAGVPSGRLQDIEDLVRSEQVAALGSLETLTRDGAGTYRTVGPPLHWNGDPLRIGRSAPALGAHTDEVLQSVGVHGDAIDALVSAGLALR